MKEGWNKSGTGRMKNRMKKTDFCVFDFFWGGGGELALLLLQTTTQLLLHRDRSGLTLMLGGPALLYPPHPHIKA